MNLVKLACVKGNEKEREMESGDLCGAGEVVMVMFIYAGTVFFFSLKRFF